MSVPTQQQYVCLQPGLPGCPAGLLQPAQHAERMFFGLQPATSDWKCKLGKIEGN